MAETDASGQAALRETVRGFCRKHADHPTDQHPGHHPSAVWQRLTGDLGLTALAIDERYGGMGATVAEVAIAVEELGRVLLPVPYLSTALAGAVLNDADPAAAALLLPGIASRALTAAFAFDADITVADGRLSGSAGHAAT